MSNSSPEKMISLQTKDSNSWDTQTDIYHTARSRFTQRLLKEIELPINIQATDLLNGSTEYGSAKSNIMPNKASRKNTLAYSLFSKSDTLSSVFPEIGTTTRNTLITRLKQQDSSSNDAPVSNSDDTKMLPVQERLLVQNVADGLFTVGTVAIRYANNDRFKQNIQTQNKENEITSNRSDPNSFPTVTLENSLAVCRSVLANCKNTHEIYQFLESLEKEILEFLLAMYPKDTEVVKKNFADIFQQTGEAHAKIHTVLRKEQQNIEIGNQLSNISIQDDISVHPNEDKDVEGKALISKDWSKAKHITIESLIAEINDLLNYLGLNPEERESGHNESDDDSDDEHTEPLFFEDNKDGNIKSTTKPQNRKRHFNWLISWWHKSTKSNSDSQNREIYSLNNENKKTNSNEDEKNKKIEDSIAGDQIYETLSSTDPSRSHFQRINSTLTLAGISTRNTQFDALSPIQQSVHQPEAQHKKHHLSKLFETGQKTQNTTGAIVSFIEKYEQSNCVPLKPHEKENKSYSNRPKANTNDLAVSQVPDPDLESIDTTIESTLYDDDVVEVHMPERISYGPQEETTNIQERFEFWARFGDPGWLEEVNQKQKPLADNWVVRLLDKYKDYQVNRYLAKHPPPSGY
ncbi:unnamed protein product [Ambrosiozyma monospora]|uniref:Unnamed protein product n=1 Tax=Ambrosiozyma monospora TaxID=43982 RepID=A0A9W6YL45_AMBMO|nr:unnamed protein product [Ambrosiozyma monospora]